MASIINRLKHHKARHMAPVKHVFYFTPYIGIVFGLALCLVVGNLYCIDDSQLLSMLLSFAVKGLDVLLLGIAVYKARSCCRREILVMGTIVLIGLLCAAYSKSVIVLKTLFLIIGSRDEEMPVVLRACWSAFALGMMAGLLSVIVGVDSPEIFRRGGLAFGFGHPNQAALYASTTIMLLLASEVQDATRFAEKKVIAIPVVVLLAYIWFTGSKTALLAVFIAMVASAVHLRIFRVWGGAEMASRWAIPCCIAPAMLLLTLWSAIVLFDSPFAQALDSFTTNRVWLNWYALMNNQITLFGQVVNLHVEGVYNALRNQGNITTTVDNTYIAGLLLYGISALLFWLACVVETTRKAWCGNNSLLFGSCVALALYAFTESQLMDPILFFPLLTYYSFDFGKSSKPTFNRRKKLCKHLK